MKIERWGLIHYSEATQRQLNAVESVFAGEDERIILCSHPPVVTVGRATMPDDIAGWSGETLETARGGRATYHGPNQVVIYPILDLRRARPLVPARDIHAYLRAIEHATVGALRGLGVSGASARAAKPGELSQTGVWVGEKKIASIGVGVKKWITYHGMALNVLRDETAFRGIRPCGFSPEVMTSVEEQLGRLVPLEECAEILSQVFTSALAYLDNQTKVEPSNFQL